MDGGGEAAEPPLAEYACDSCWMTWSRAGAGQPCPVQLVKNDVIAPASTDRRRTWRGRAEAERLAALLRESGKTAGIGLVSHERYSGERVVQIDLDAAVFPGTGVLKDWAEAILERFPSYSERSPSGTGLHIIFRVAAADVPAVEALLRKGRKIRAGRKWFRKTPNDEKAEGIEFIWRGYARFTGDRLRQQPRDVRLISVVALQWLCEFAERFKRPGGHKPPNGVGGKASGPAKEGSASVHVATPPKAATIPKPIIARPAGAAEEVTRTRGPAAKQRPGRRMEWDAALVADLAARLDDTEFAVAAAYATVGYPTRDGLAEAGLPPKSLLRLTGRQHGSGSSPKTISAAKARLVGMRKILTEIESAIPPSNDRSGRVARFAFKAWWSPGQDKSRYPRVVLAPDLWDAMLRGGHVRRRSLRIIMRILSELALAGHHPTEAFRPKPCVLARNLGVKPDDVNEALDDAEAVGLIEAVERRRLGKAASYRISPRGAARWPTREKQANERGVEGEAAPAARAHRPPGSICVPYRVSGHSQMGRFSPDRVTQ